MYQQVEQDKPVTQDRRSKETGHYSRRQVKKNKKGKEVYISHKQCPKKK